LLCGEVSLDYLLHEVTEQIRFILSEA
jgi:hypothetical protein